MESLIALFTHENAQILKCLFREPLYISEIADKVGCSPSTAHRAVSLLKKLQLVSLRKLKNKVVVELVRESALLKSVKRLLNVDSLLCLGGLEKLQKHGTVGIYGSFANGTDTPESDIDLWLCSESKIRALELRKIVRGIEKQLGKRISLIILSPAKLKKLRTEDPEFYHRLKFTSISLGEEIFD